METITATYEHENDDWTITVSGRGQELTGKAPGIIAARDRADQLVEKLASNEHPTVVHLLNGTALEFTSAYMTARLTLPEQAPLEVPPSGGKKDPAPASAGTVSGATGASPTSAAPGSAAASAAASPEPAARASSATPPASAGAGSAAAAPASTGPASAAATSDAPGHPAETNGSATDSAAVDDSATADTPATADTSATPAAPTAGTPAAGTSVPAQSTGKPGLPPSKQLPKEVQDRTAGVTTPGTPSGSSVISPAAHA